MTLPSESQQHQCNYNTNNVSININKYFEGTNVNNENGMNYYEEIIPNIYISDEINYWTNNKFITNGFTHIINIDKFPLLLNNNIDKIENLENITEKVEIPVTQTNYNNYSNFSNDTHLYNLKKKSLDIIDLDFGEYTYLTTVLPNCYKAVKFIDKAFKCKGKILILESNDNQKCNTIIIGYLMYKYHLNFIDAFQKLKKTCPNVKLDHFFIKQLYEYEPILQVQRIQTRGHSCSGEIRRLHSKRKNLSDDVLTATTKTTYNNNNNESINYKRNITALKNDNNSDVLME